MDFRATYRLPRPIKKRSGRPSIATVLGFNRWLGAAFGVTRQGHSMGSRMRLAYQRFKFIERQHQTSLVPLRVYLRARDAFLAAK